jgi:hypothetical protein
MLKYDFNGLCVFLESYSGYQNQLINVLESQCRVATKWGKHPAATVAKNAVDFRHKSGEANHQELIQKIQQINEYLIIELDGKSVSESTIKKVIAKANDLLDSFFVEASKN